MRARRDLDRHAFDDFQSVSFQSYDLSGIVREQPHGLNTQISQDLRADTVRE